MRIKIGTTITTEAITSVQVVAAVGAHKQGLPLKSSVRTSLPAPTLLNPKNHPKEHLPLMAMPLNTLWQRMRWLRHTRMGVESTKLTPVHLPSSTCSTKISLCYSFSVNYFISNSRYCMNEIAFELYH